MRLSEARIEFIATQIAEGLQQKRRVRYRGNKNKFTAEIGKVILEDMRIEDEIDREAEAHIRKMKRDIPEGSPEWVAIYQQEKEELARRRNYQI
jgi:hypothetical protein